MKQCLWVGIPDWEIVFPFKVTTFAAVGAQLLTKLFFLKTLSFCGYV